MNNNRAEANTVEFRDGFQDNSQPQNQNQLYTLNTPKVNYDMLQITKELNLQCRLINSQVQDSQEEYPIRKAKKNVNIVDCLNISSHFISALFSEKINKEATRTTLLMVLYKIEYQSNQNLQQLQFQINKSNERQSQSNLQREIDAKKKNTSQKSDGNFSQLRENKHVKGSLSYSKLEKEFKLSENSSRLKFKKIEQPHSSQGIAGSDPQKSSQIYQLQGQNRNKQVRTSSLMKNFCFFINGDYEQNMKMMYDESLTEWKQFQNSKINEPKKIQRNSITSPSQNNILFSLGKDKKFSLKELQKVRSVQIDNEKQNQQTQPQLISQMNLRRKSCECVHCGKLNSKQLQLQDLPFIPKQQKKYYDIKFRVTSILAAPIRQPLKPQKPSSPQTPRLTSKSQTNIPANNGPRKSLVYAGEKTEKLLPQKSRIGMSVSRNDNNISSNISPNTSIDKYDDSNRNKRPSSRNLKWGDQVSETSIEENPSSSKKRHLTVLVRKNSKFDAPMSPVNSIINGNSNRNSTNNKVEGVLEKSVKEKSKCMVSFMNFLKRIIEKVQKEEQQKQNLEVENSQQSNIVTDSKLPPPPPPQTQSQITQNNIKNGSLTQFEDADFIAGKSVSQNFNNNEFVTQEDEHNEQMTHSKKMQHFQSSSFNPRELARKRSSVGELFKPRSMKVSSSTFQDSIKLNQKSQKEVIKSMESLSQFRDRYLKQFAEQAKTENNTKRQKKKRKETPQTQSVRLPQEQLKGQSQPQIQPINGVLKRDFQVGKHSSEKDEERQKMDKLIDRLMVFSENHTPLLQSPYFTELKTEEQLFDKQFNKKNFYQKVFTKNVITDEQPNNPSQTTRSFINNSNLYGNSTLLNVPSINTLTNLNQSSSPLPQNKVPLTALSGKSNQASQMQQLQQNGSQMGKGFSFLGTNYFTSQTKRNKSQTDLFLKQQAKFSSYLQPVHKTFQSQNFLLPPPNINHNSQFHHQNGHTQLNPPSTAPYFKNGQTSIQTSGRKSYQYNHAKNQSPRIPKSSSSAARFGSFQSSYGINKGELHNGIDNHTTIKSFKELDLLLDGPVGSQQNSSKQSSLNSTLYNNKFNSNPQQKIAIITQDRKKQNFEKNPYLNSGYQNNQNNQLSSEENTLLLQK